jgi:hypothetical protein
MRNATELKMTPTAPLDFVREQILTMNPGSAPVWIVGLIAGLVGLHGARGRVLSWIYVVVLGIILTAGRGRASYLAVAYPMLFALGACSVERAAGRARMSWLRPATATLVIVAGLPLIPLALPVLPVETYVRYQVALGSRRARMSVRKWGLYRSTMPTCSAGKGWCRSWSAHTSASPPRIGSIAASSGTTMAKRARSTSWAEAGLPRALSGHNSYWIWGRDDPDTTWNVIIVIGGDRADNAAFFDSLEVVGRTANRWSMPYERGLDISIGRGPRFRRGEAWPRLREFI